MRVERADVRPGQDVGPREHDRHEEHDAPEPFKPDDDEPIGLKRTNSTLNSYVSPKRRLRKIDTSKYVGLGGAPVIGAAAPNAYEA